MNLTPRRVAVLKALAHYPHSYPISLRELASQVGLAYSSTTHQVGRLAAAGLVRRGPHNAPRTLMLAPGVAVSRNGQVARIVPVRRCEPCGLTLPADHHCEADLHVSMDWSTP